MNQATPSTSTPTGSTASANNSASLRATSHPSLATTSSSSPLAKGETTTGQVTSSQPLPQGGHRVEVQLANGQQLSLTTAKAFSPGQEVQVTGRSETSVEVRLVNLPQAQQNLVNQLVNLPSFTLRPANPSLPSLPPNTASLATVTASQPLSSNQGFLLTLQLPNNQSLQVISSLPFAQASQLYLASDAQGQLTAKPLPASSLSLARVLAANLPLVTSSPGLVNSSGQGANVPAPSLASLLASASEHLRYALPRQSPMQTTLKQLTQLLPQLIRATPGLTQATAASSPNTVSSSGAPLSITTASTTIATAATQLASLTSITSGEGKAPLAQQQLNQLLSQSGVTSNNAQAPATRLVALVQQLVNSFMQGTNPPNAPALQAFLASSGMFFESSLLTATGVNNGDIKLQLSHLANLIRQELAANHGPARQEVLQQLNQQVQAMTSRLQVQQFSSLQAVQATVERGQPAQVVQMDLPYAIRGEWFEAKLEIRRWLEEKETEEALEEYLRRTKVWEVRLHFDLENYGRLHTHLRLQDETLNADVWIEEQAAYLPIKNKAEVLASRLRRLGADIETVNCYQGNPPTEAQAPKTKAQIINTKI